MNAPLKDNLVRIRKDRRLSQQQLADLVGVRQNTIASLETGKTLRSKYLPKIARVLRCRIEELDPDLDVMSAGEGVIVPKVDLGGERDLPVYASAEGGEGQLIVSVDAVEWVMRPAPLSKVRDGYGLIITGHSMEPEFRPGDILLVHPHLPPSIGESYVFYSVDEGGAHHARVKYLARVTASDWVVRQWSPPDGEKEEFRLSRKDWPKAHRVIGKYSRR